jgi:hypothetical protein
LPSEVHELDDVDVAWTEAPKLVVDDPGAGFFGVVLSEMLRRSARWRVRPWRPGMRGGSIRESRG